MPKYPRTFRPLAAALAATLLAAHAARADGPDPQATYDRIRSLAGTWTGRMEDPLSGPPVTVRYEVVSGGQAVIEYQNPGQSYEMVTVYYLANGRLRATHYSGAGNQPAYKLGRDSTDELILLAFDGGTGFDADQDGHVRHGEIRLVAPDRIEERWFHFVGPKEQGVTHWFLNRQPAAAAPKPAPTQKPAVAAPPAPAAR